MHSCFRRCSGRVSRACGKRTPLPTRCCASAFSVLAPWWTYEQQFFGGVDPPESIPLSSSFFSSPLASVLFDDAGSALGPGAPFPPTERERRQIALFFSPPPHFLLLPFRRAVKTTVDPVKGEKKGEGRIPTPLFITWAGQKEGERGGGCREKEGKIGLRGCKKRATYADDACKKASFLGWTRAIAYYDTLENLLRSLLYCMLVFP